MIEHAVPMRPIQLRRPSLLSSGTPVSSSSRSTHGKMNTGTAFHAAPIRVVLYSAVAVAYFGRPSEREYSSQVSVMTARISAIE